MCPYEKKDYMYYYYLLELRIYNPSLVLVQPRTFRPYITEILLMGRKESNPKKVMIIIEICIRLTHFKLQA